MRKLVLILLAICVVAAIVGLLVVASGVIPVGATDGHWPITELFLGFSMERSVAFHSRGIETPPLDDEALILRGAGHYETGCAPCHGSPALPDPIIASALTPEAPGLGEEITEWKPRELFYIIRHGVKMTGMPAWPTPEREDEVWAVVAFLLRYPELDARGYRALVEGNAPRSSDGLGTIPVTVVARCARCHGIDGNGRGNAAFPKLAGQNESYMRDALEAYSRGERHSGIMQPIASSLSPEAIRQVTRYYASREASSEGRSFDEGAIERGERLALNENHGEKPCTECHHADTKDDYPVLEGQYADYIVQQLELFAERKRGGAEHADLMDPIAPKLTEQDRRDVAAWFASRDTFRFVIE